MPETNSTTKKARATGLIAYKAVIDHAIEHGLQAPTSLDIRDDSLRVYINGDTQAWVDSIDITREARRDGLNDDREIVYVFGHLPAELFGITVQLVFSRKVTPSALRLVTA